jgi:hypothetical protein
MNITSACDWILIIFLLLILLALEVVKLEEHANNMAEDERISLKDRIQVHFQLLHLLLSGERLINVLGKVDNGHLKERQVPILARVLDVESVR